VYRRSANSPLRKAFPILFVGLLFGFVAGCGAPGDPQPPSPPIPAPISDLTARQQGNGVQLVFTLPARTVSGDRLAEPPAMEIFRGSVKLNGSPDNKTFKLVYTIPGALADAYASQGKIQFTDPVAPDDVRANPGATYAYRVRTRASKKKDSADSNLVAVKLYPVAEKIPSLAARVTQNAIELTWPAPPNAAGQISAQSVNGYHV